MALFRRSARNRKCFFVLRKCKPLESERRLRRETVQHTSERDRFANVGQTAHPCDATLHAETEAGVGERAVATQIEIPLEGFFRQLVMRDRGFQRLEALFALTTSDDLAVPFWRENIDAERKAWVVCVTLHIERLHLGRV